MKKTLQQKMGVGQPKTMIEALVLAFVKFAIVAGMGIGASVGLLWALANDETNLDAQYKWSEQAKELEARIELEKEHSKVSF